MDGAILYQTNFTNVLRSNVLSKVVKPNFT